jgi:hypothetical protein
MKTYGFLLFLQIIQQEIYSIMKLDHLEIIKA